MLILLGKVSTFCVVALANRYWSTEQTRDLAFLLNHTAQLSFFSTVGAATALVPILSTYPAVAFSKTLLALRCVRLGLPIYAAALGVLILSVLASSRQHSVELNGAIATQLGLAGLAAGYSTTLMAVYTGLFDKKGLLYLACVGGVLPTLVLAVIIACGAEPGVALWVYLAVLCAPVAHGLLAQLSSPDYSDIEMILSKVKPVNMTILQGNGANAVVNLIVMALAAGRLAALDYVTLSIAIQVRNLTLLIPSQFAGLMTRRISKTEEAALPAIFRRVTGAYLAIPVLVLLLTVVGLKPVLALLALPAEEGRILMLGAIVTVAIAGTNVISKLLEAKQRFKAVRGANLFFSILYGGLGAIFAFSSVGFLVAIGVAALLQIGYYGVVLKQKR